jgi:hypothetical protein
MFADIQVAEQTVEVLRFVDVIIGHQGCKKKTFAELARTYEQLIAIRFIFEHLNIPRLVHINVVFENNVFEIRVAVRQSFHILIFVHNELYFLMFNEHKVTIFVIIT